MASRTLVRRQLRGFVTVWTALTGIIAVATFFAIYLTYGGGIPASGTRGSVALIPTNTPAAESAVVVTDAPTLAGVAATALPATSLPATNPPASAVPATTVANTASNTVSDTAPTTDPGTGGDLTTTEDPTAAGVAVAQVDQPTIAPTVLPVDDKRFQVGIQVQSDRDRNPDNQDGWMREVRDKMGFGWFKMQIRWEEVEPEKGDYQWAVIRFALNSAEKFGLKVMASVVSAPDWARESGVDLEKQGPPANSQDYVNFVTKLVQKFPGQIHGIEVWNEQNLDREWMSNGGLNAVSYVNLLRQTYQAVKAIDPGIIIISGALSPGGGWTEPDGTVSAVDDFTYMDGLLGAGMLEYADCVGVHHNGYNIGPSVQSDEVDDDPTAQFRGPFDNPHHSWSFRTTMEGYYQKIQLAGGDTPLCVTEFGWASTEDLDGVTPGFEFAADNTLEEQKTWTIEALNNMDEWGFVWLAFIWNFNYGPQAGWAIDNDNVPYSIIGPDWVHRPVYGAIIEWQQARKAQGLP